MLKKITKIMVETEDGERFQWEGSGNVRVYETYVKDDKDKKTYFRAVDAGLRLEDITEPKG